MKLGLPPCARAGLYLEVPSFLFQEEGPPYVEAGVVSVEALLVESKTDDIEVEVLLLLFEGLVGV